MKITVMVGAIALGIASSAWSASPQEIDQLGKSLTPVGAEKAGNKEGSIPAWDGVDQPLNGWAFGKNRMDYWKYKSEAPLFVIDASNVAKYADKLSPGQIKLVKETAGYTMPVYPTHRNCGYPDFVLENTKNGAAKSKIAANGWSLENATLPGIPFPVPKSGIEALWNFLDRYQGVGVDFQKGFTTVSAAPGSTKSILIGWNQLFYYPWGAKGAHSEKDTGGLQGGIYYAYQSPDALAGQGIVQRYYDDKDAESFYYFTGQRRVRRLPSYAYDTPLIGFENQYPADMSFIFFGNPDRFDWKIVGKKEVYVPYNNFQYRNFNLDLKKDLLPTFASPDVRRYELHRVWEIEGTVKPGVRHSAPKKVVYLDEDTWLAVVGDDYDAQGKLWKAKEVGVLPTWEVGACTNIVQQNYYDFLSGRYVSDSITIGTGKDILVTPAANGNARLQDSFFTSESLRSISER